MNKVLLFILLGLVTIVLSANEEETKTRELEELEDESNLELKRVQREADPKKKKKKNGRKPKGKGKKSKRNKPKRKLQRKLKKGKTIKKKKQNLKKNKRKGEKKSRKQAKKNNRKAVSDNSVVGKKSRKQAKKNNRKAVSDSSVGRSTGCGRAVNATCLDVAVKLMKIVNSKITNFLVQHKRIQKYNKTGGNKKGKKGLFGPIASKVIDVGGGNASNLACSGNTTSPGAKKLKSIIDTLQQCEDNIHQACDDSKYPTPNMTEALACKSDMEKMKKSVEACVKKEGAEACTCWQDADLKATADRVKKCDISGNNKLVTAQHKYCTGNFSACKKVEDTAVDYIYTCSQTADELIAKAQQTKKNADALEATKAKTETLAGNSTGRSSHIRKRATSVSTCGDYVSLSAKLLIIAGNAPQSSLVETMSKILSAVSDALSCSTTEKASLTKQTKTYTKIVIKVKATYNGLKASIEDNTGPTTDEAIIAATTVASTDGTKKMAARRNRLVRDILNNLN